MKREERLAEYDECEVTFCRTVLDGDFLQEEGKERRSEGDFQNSLSSDLLSFCLPVQSSASSRGATRRWNSRLRAVTERVRRHRSSDGIEHAGLVSIQRRFGGAGPMNECRMPRSAIECDHVFAALLDEDRGERITRIVARGGDQDATSRGDT